MHPAQRSKPACAPRASQAPGHLQGMWVKGNSDLRPNTSIGEWVCSLTPRPPQAPHSFPVAFWYLEMPVSPEESRFPHSWLGGEGERREQLLLSSLCLNELTYLLHRDGAYERQRSLWRFPALLYWENLCQFIYPPPFPEGSAKWQEGSGWKFEVNSPYLRKLL